MKTETYKNWMSENLSDFIDFNGDVNMTELGEGCANHFGVMTELGDSEEETIIFEVATEFYNR